MAGCNLPPVIERLSGFLNQGPTTFEITILPIQSTEDERLSVDDSIVLVEGQHLGMDARSLPWITREIRQCYKLQKRQLQQQQEDSTTTIKKKKKNEDIASFRNLLTVTSCLLLVNPDHATAWADRRRSLLHFGGDDDNYDDKYDDCWRRELTFLNLLMTQHSKAPSSWGHRKYVLGKILETNPKRRNVDFLTSLAQDEVDTCTRVAERFPKNYYAWTHRRYLWTVFKPLILEENSNGEDNERAVLLRGIWTSEFERICKWLETHISDHSAAHYGAQVLQLLMTPSTPYIYNPEEMATKALEESRTLVNRQPATETKWIFRRMVVQVLLLQAKTNASIRALVQSEIVSVYHEYVAKDTSSSCLDKHHIHAWTFLVWCMLQMQKTLGAGGENLLAQNKTPRQAIPSNAISLLQRHLTVVHHQKIWTDYDCTMKEAFQ